MDFGSLAKGLPFFTVFCVLVTRSCLGACVTYGADWVVLPVVLDSATCACLRASVTDLGVG